MLFCIGLTFHTNLKKLVARQKARCKNSMTRETNFFLLFNVNRDVLYKTRHRCAECVNFLFLKLMEN